VHCAQFLDVLILKRGEIDAVVVQGQRMIADTGQQSA
jgi:hypothetical protein